MTSQTDINALCNPDSQDFGGNIGYKQEYYQQICALRNKIDNESEMKSILDGDLFAECTKPGEQGAKEQFYCAQIGDIVDLPVRFVESVIKGMFTPSAAAQLGTIEGLKMIAKSRDLMRDLNEIIKQEISEIRDTIDIGGEDGVGSLFELDEEIFSVAAANAGVAAVCVADMVDSVLLRALTRIFGEEFASRAGAFMLSMFAEDTIASMGLEGLGAILDWVNPVADALFYVQIGVSFFGQLLDSIDPCDLNQELDAASLNGVVDKLNSTFRSTVLGSIDSTVDSLGNVYESEKFPLEVSWSSKDFVGKDKALFKKLASKHTTLFLNHLTMNSIGEAIAWPKSNKKHFEQNVIKVSHFATAERKIGMILGLGNTVVENVVVKYFPLIITLVAVLVGLIIYAIW